MEYQKIESWMDKKALSQWLAIQKRKPNFVRYEVIGKKGNDVHVRIVQTKEEE